MESPVNGLVTIRSPLRNGLQNLLQRNRLPYFRVGERFASRLYAAAASTHPVLSPSALSPLIKEQVRSQDRPSLLIER
jgi:hypothetical protein